MNFTKEQIAKAKAAKSAAELLEMAKKENFPMTEEEAAKIFAELHQEGELSDAELCTVAGGSKGTPEPKYVVGNIVIKHCANVEKNVTYEILSVNNYSESIDSWEYTCLWLEENCKIIEHLDDNPNVFLYRWSRNDL